MRASILHNTQGDGVAQCNVCTLRLAIHHSPSQHAFIHTCMQACDMLRVVLKCGAALLRPAQCKQAIKNTKYDIHAPYRPRASRSQTHTHWSQPHYSISSLSSYGCLVVLLMWLDSTFFSQLQGKCQCCRALRSGPCSGALPLFWEALVAEQSSW